ncbi:PIN domain-like protein [Rickenella mellea]|uniref:PIN domain-like protein n=1 Tax=Rickenella mellea TaxID=50990 RepID=A0A4Y7PTA5_9AGAM|nr:PIN domain-like protein [Rickenella mellea]
MGVPGLWDILKPSAQHQHLGEFVTNAFKSSGGRAAFVIGVDVSLWFHQAQHPFVVGHASAGRNPELRVLFRRLALYSKLPATVLFVFDGPQRPAIKRKTNVIPTEHWIATDFRKLINAFGFHTHTAPGEAEAELAVLNRAGIVHAVFTDDADALVFGAETVVRVGESKKTRNAVAVYQMSQVREHSEVGLDAGDLFLFAVLCGGDYDTRGLDGCGPRLSRELAHCGYGATLFDAVRDLEKQDFPLFLHQWRAVLQEELRTNCHGRLSRRHVKVASSITAEFPDINVLSCYAKPCVTGFPLAVDSSLQMLSHQEVDIPALAHLCQSFFGWETNIINDFRTAVWPGAIVQALLLPASDSEHNASFSTTSIDSSEIVPLQIRHQHSLKASGYVPEVQIQVPVADLIHLTTNPLPPTNPIAAVPTSNADKTSIATPANVASPLAIREAFWIPAVVAEHADSLSCTKFYLQQSPGRGEKRKRTSSITTRISKMKPSDPRRSDIATSRSSEQSSDLRGSSASVPPSSILMPGLRITLG